MDIVFRHGSYTLLDGQEASEVLQESTQGRKALKSKVEVTLGSNLNWPTGPTKGSCFTPDPEDELLP